MVVCGTGKVLISTENQWAEKVGNLISDRENGKLMIKGLGVFAVCYLLGFTIHRLFI